MSKPEMDMALKIYDHAQSSQDIAAIMIGEKDDKLDTVEPNDTPQITSAKSGRKKQLALESRVDKVDEALIATLTMNDFTLSEITRRQLLAYPYTFFPEWDGDTSAQRLKGSVQVTGEIKWLVNNNGVINPNPLESGLTTPFRSTSEFDEDGTKRQWMEKELCITGMVRWHNGTRYRVKPRGDGGSLAVDSSTPPPNDTNSWEVAAEQ